MPCSKKYYYFGFGPLKDCTVQVRVVTRLRVVLSLLKPVPEIQNSSGIRNVSVLLQTHGRIFAKSDAHGKILNWRFCPPLSIGKLTIAKTHSV
jgi:hypothetical protein